MTTCIPSGITAKKWLEHEPKVCVSIVTRVVADGSEYNPDEMMEVPSWFYSPRV